eukprot:symbB.v1.2.007413.t1/scaffold453.1/size202423/4
MGILGDSKSARDGDDSPEKRTTPSKAEQDAINREEIVLDSEEEPEQEGWKLWHFVKGLSPKKPSLLSLFGGWRSRTEAEVLEEVPPSRVAKLRGGGRTTLPKRNGSTARPNIRRVISKMAKNKNYVNYILGKKKALEADFDANSSRAAKESRRSTVKKILASASSRSKGGKIDGEDIKTVAAVLKDANYKSAHLYLGDLKLMHIEGDHDWTPYLERIYKQCKLSTSRGIGPRKKAMEVPEDVWAEEAKGEGVEKLKIHLPQRLFAMGVQWMMREIEIAALRTSNVHFNPKNRTVTLQWLESKMDQSGKSFTRVLQCLCGDGCDLRCPYENLKVIVQKVREVYGVEEEDPWLATTKAGVPATKQQVISAWQGLFGKAVTGHSTRRSGALQYIRKGWSVSQVAFLGRWKSNIILEYADEALQSIPVNSSGNFNTANSNHAVIQQASVPGDLALQQEIVLELKEEVKALRSGNVKVKLKLEKMQQEWEEKQQAAGERELPLLVKALKSETVHYNASQVLCSPPFTWRTVCGWHYHSGEITFMSNGTETINQALKGLAEIGEKEGRQHFITQASEHVAVLEVCKALELRGCEVTYLPVDSEGLVSPDALEAAITPRTICISIMLLGLRLGQVLAQVPIQRHMLMGQRGGRPAQLDPCSSFSKSSCPPERCILEGEACSVQYHHYPSTNCGSGGSEFLGMSVATAEACLALCPGCEAVLWWPYLERECYKCLDPATREHDSGMSPGPSMVLVHSSVNQATFTTTALPTTTLSTVTTTSNTMDLSCSHLNKASCQKPRCHWTGVSCEWGYFDYAGMKCGDQEFLKMSIAAAEGCLALCPDCVVEWWEEGEQACSKCLSGLQWYDGSDFAAPPHVLVPRSLAFPSPFLPMNATSAQGAFACRGAHPNDNSFAYYKVVPDFSGDLTSCKAHCAAMRGLCKGVEYSPGRCELWTRPEGIGAVASLPSGHFQCLRYAAAPVFELVNGADQVCRGASISDNSPNYFSVIAVSNLRIPTMRRELYSQSKNLSSGQGKLPRESMCTAIRLRVLGSFRWM